MAPGSSTRGLEGLSIIAAESKSGRRFYVVSLLKIRLRMICSLLVLINWALSEKRSFGFLLFGSKGA